ncbi:hypothetical protein P170DRAFT_513377 [Aspergillus steynii IBT 23096]|uniref:Zn(2)-C6 fungal-type domain-containing protein n=1 Tax=Aspergillus steynii IBT 23096 TaxID=1392250 RepID=A0A2I2FTZ9_9EURO|nr:uncharacterized protein P170DRAFT_513377 [Aspergillus steynii IBT 23096]PLB44115.1 hypothetical protein P170DRAFT_513377 [Aspergillus steynii IBT 23096]
MDRSAEETPTRRSSSPHYSRPITRISRACEQCRARKVRCNGHTPCSRCQSRRSRCEYRLPKQSSRSSNLASQAAAAVGDLSSTTSPAGSAYHVTGDPLPSYKGHTDPIQLKRQRELRAGIGVSNVDTGAFQFFGPSSQFCFIQRLHERIQHRGTEAAVGSGSSAADGVRRWKLEQFLFPMSTEASTAKCQPDACFPRELGDSFISAYFDIIHPQAPVIAYSDVLESWQNLWLPPWQRQEVKGDDILFMVLAIGARVSSVQGQQDISASEGWANHFSHKAVELNAMADDICLSTTHFFLLRGIFAYQLMRSNDAYLHLGTAARMAMALGINRLQVVDGANPKAHRLRSTFWTIYAHERSCALYTGRPSIFRDDLNDAASVEDLSTSISPESIENRKYQEPMTACAFIRAMARLGHIADRVAVQIYSPHRASTMANVAEAHEAIMECDLELQSITNDLPSYLHFYDSGAPLGQGWQEVQRMALGNSYHFVRMLMYRPALVFATFFDTRASAHSHAVGPMQLDRAIHETLHSATSLVELNHDVYFRRHPSAKFDGSSGTLLLSACATLLYDVLDPIITSDHAKAIFSTVELAIQCLDEMQHAGPMSGKALSLEVMEIAKSTIPSAGEDTEISEYLLGSFPWLQPRSYGPQSGAGPFPLAHAETSGVPTRMPGAAIPMDPMPLVAAPEANYMSHWLEAGFEPEEIPNSLY